MRVRLNPVLTRGQQAARRFTLYTSYSYPKDYLNFAGIRDDGKVRLTFNQADKQ